MQIPYEGTEFEVIEDRAQQASSRSHNELIALKTFTAKGSTITPTLLAYKEGRQDSNGLITYLVWNILPGLRLGNNLGSGPFFQLPRAERDEIRSLFPHKLQVSSQPQSVSLSVFIYTRPLFADDLNNMKTRNLLELGF
jgi:hypothetical protein